MIRVEWAITRSGKVPGWEFFDGLTQAEKAKLYALFKRLGDHGQIRNTEQFKKISDDLWELKKFQIRLFGSFRPDGRFVLATGIKKKQNRHKMSDLEKAKRVLQESDLRERSRKERRFE